MLPPTLRGPDTVPCNRIAPPAATLIPELVVMVCEVEERSVPVCKATVPAPAFKAPPIVKSPAGASTTAPPLVVIPWLLAMFLPALRFNGSGPPDAEIEAPSDKSLTATSDKGLDAPAVLESAEDTVRSPLAPNPLAVSIVTPIPPFNSV